MMDNLSLYKVFGSFLILAFTSSSARCSTTRVILAMIFSLSPQRLSCSRKSYHWWQVGIRDTKETLIKDMASLEGTFVTKATETSEKNKERLEKNKEKLEKMKQEFEKTTQKDISRKEGI